MRWPWSVEPALLRGMRELQQALTNFGDAFTRECVELRHELAATRRELADERARGRSLQDRVDELARDFETWRAGVQ